MNWNTLFTGEWDHLMHQVQDWWKGLNVWPLTQSIAYLLLGMFSASLVSNLVGRTTQKHASRHHAILFQKTCFYLIFLFFLVLSLKNLGFDLSSVIAGAGIGAAAVAFASQAGMSNVVSGLFLLGEKPFVVGDTLMLQDTIGEVSSIGLLSVALRTSDNTLIRIPNELLLKSQFKNLSHFPIRRLDVPLTFHAHEDISQIRCTILGALEAHPLCLMQPAIEFQFLELVDSSIRVQVRVWVEQKDFQKGRSEVIRLIQAALAEQRIHLPVKLVCPSTISG